MLQALLIVQIRRHGIGLLKKTNEKLKINKKLRKKKLQSVTYDEEIIRDYKLIYRSDSLKEFAVCLLGSTSLEPNLLFFSLLPF